MRRPCSGHAEPLVPSSPPWRAVTRSALCVLLLTGPVVLSTAAPALAHTALVSSTPSASAVVAGPVSTVTLVFSQPVSTRAAQVVVTGPDGVDVAQGPAQVSGTTVSAPVTSFPTAGGYRLAYRVLAEDGHPVTGEVPFEVAPEAAAPAAPPAPAAAATAVPSPVAGSAQAPAAAPQPSGTGVAPVALAGLGGVAGALVVGAVRAGRRRRVGR